MSRPRCAARCSAAPRAPLGFAQDNGQQVLVRARVGLYEARGEFQLVVEHMEAAGEACCCAAWRS